MCFIQFYGWKLLIWSVVFIISKRRFVFGVYNLYPKVISKFQSITQKKSFELITGVSCLLRLTLCRSFICGVWEACFVCNIFGSKSHLTQPKLVLTLYALLHILICEIDSTVFVLEFINPSLWFNWAIKITSTFRINLWKQRLESE